MSGTLYTVLSGQFTALSSLTDKFILYDQNLSGIAECIGELASSLSGDGQYDDYVPPSQDDDQSTSETESEIEADLSAIKEQLGILD